MSAPATGPRPHHSFPWRESIIRSLWWGFIAALISPVLTLIPVFAYPFYLVVFSVGETVFGFAIPETWHSNAGYIVFVAGQVIFALIFSVFRLVHLFFRHPTTEARAMTPKTNIRVLLLRGPIVGTVLGILACAVGALSINPGEGQEGYLPPDSFRYRFGVWLNGFNGPIIILCAWPAFILGILGVHHVGFILGFFCAVIGGIGWVIVWEKLRGSYAGVFRRQ